MDKSIKSQIAYINARLLEIDAAFNGLLKELLFGSEVDIPDTLLNEVRNYAEHLMWKNNSALKPKERK